VLLNSSTFDGTCGVGMWRDGPVGFNAFMTHRYANVMFVMC
jgi:hypothetical protein